MGRVSPQGVPVATGRVLHVLLPALERCGVERAPLLKRAGLGTELVGSPERRITHGQAEALWTAARELSGDSAIGLHAAGCVNPASLDVIGYLAAASDTGRGAFERVGGYLGLLHVGIELYLELGPVALLRFRHRGDVPVCASSSEFTAVLIVRLARLLGGLAKPPLEVRFTHAEPPYADVCTALLEAPVLFNAPHNAVVYRREDLERPLSGRDDRLADILERHAQDLLARLPRDTSLAEQVRERLAEQLSGTPPDLETVAGELGLGARTLRRRLGDEGTSFRRILDGLRRERAAALLEDPDLGSDAAAYLLGFSDASAWHKAMRRWRLRAGRGR